MLVQDFQLQILGWHLTRAQRVDGGLPRGDQRRPVGDAADQRVRGWLVFTRGGGDAVGLDIAPFPAILRAVAILLPGDDEETVCRLDDLVAGLWTSAIHCGAVAVAGEPGILHHAVVGVINTFDKGGCPDRDPQAEGVGVVLAVDIIDPDEGGSLAARVPKRFGAVGTCYRFGDGVVV